MWRIVEISGTGYSIRVKNKNIYVSKEGMADVSIPFRDVHSFIFHGNQNLISEEFLYLCSANGIPVTICDEKHMPVGMFLPYNQHVDFSDRMAMQLNASLPRKKQAWKRIVCAKILAQARTLDLYGKNNSYILIKLSESVKSGDSSNVEGQAAKIYFQSLFGSEFQRRNEDEDINILLNYAYSIIRSSVARAIVAHGLNPSFSIFHSNRNNNFALVDDLMEPLRPIADELVYKIVTREVDITLSSIIKKELISLSSAIVSIDDMTYEMSEAIKIYVMDYLKYIGERGSSIRIPISNNGIT